MGVRSVRRLDIPHEPGEWIEVRLLNPRQMRLFKAQASSAQELDGENRTETMGWELLASVCRECIVGWSYAERGIPIPVTQDNIDDLDAVTSKHVFEFIMGVEDEAGKAEGSSTSPSA